MYKMLFTCAALVALTVAHAEPVNYKIDSDHTYVHWEVRHFGTSTNRGRWDRKEGMITIDREAKSGSAEVRIDLTSLSTGFSTFNEHLSGKNFFKGSAEAVFIGTKFSFDGDKVSAVEGELSLLGKTNPVTLQATHFNCYDNPFFKTEVCGGDFEATIKRSQWGMGYAIPNIPDEVRLLIQIEAVRQDS